MRISIRNIGRSMRTLLTEIAAAVLMFALLNPLLSQTPLQNPNVTSTFTGDLRPGGSGHFTLTVTMNDGAPVTGDIFIHDELPHGFQAVSIEGDGWRCAPNHLLCFHSGGFASGSDPIILNVELSGTDGLSPPFDNHAWIEHPAGRRQVDATGECNAEMEEAARSGYNVLQYNAQDGITGWMQPTLLSEGRKSSTKPKPVSSKLGPFLPTILTSSNRIMVEVCGLKFDTVLNVTQAVVNLPENAADIRGSTPTPEPTPLATSPSVDALQAATSSSASAIAATVPSNANPTGIVNNTMLTLGSAKPGSANGALIYNPLSINATAADFAHAVLAYKAEASATQDVMRIICKDAKTPCGDFPNTAVGLDANAANGSVWNVDVRAHALYDRINQFHEADYTASDQGTFDDAVAEAARFATILGSLNSKITFATLNTRVAALAATYSALSGDLLTLQQIQIDDRPATNPKCPDDLVASASNSTGVTGEYCYVTTFLKHLDALGICPTNSKLSIAKESKGCDATGSDSPDPVITPNDLYKEMGSLRDGLQQINQTTNDALAVLNRWYDESNVVYTDSLTPSSSNADLRIAISANETYVPLVLNTPSSATPVSTSSSAATTTAGHFESSTIIRVERVVHFNLVGGVIITHVPNANYSYVQSNIVPTAGATTYSPCPGFAAIPPATGSASVFCPVQTSATQYQVAGMAGVNWIPWGRNYYPEGTEPQHFLRRQFNKFGILVASSITSLGSGFGGGSFEPTNGFDLFAGVASAHSQTLPSGTGPFIGTSAPASVQTVSTLHFGFSFGVGFDLGVFKSLFSGTSTPTIP